VWARASTLGLPTEPLLTGGPGRFASLSSPARGRAADRLGGQGALLDSQVSARVGIDFGGVIVRNLKEVPGEDTGLAFSAGLHVARDGAYDAIRRIVAACDGRVWIVSKAGPRMQARTLAWLDAVEFFSRTDLEPDNVRFCLQREDKERICRDLGITHFIDDRVHVMQILRGTVQHLYLLGEPGGEKFCPPWATFASSWPEVVDLVIRSVRKDRPTRE